MEKMNQVSVSEFMELTKTQMYDKAVEMVEKYNRLVDICNDSSERIAELVIERDNLSKGVQKLIAEKEDLIEKHNAYTSALNADIAAKAAKIELIQKELDGRKAGYAALKTQMDTKYISIEEHNDICKAYESENESLKKQVEYLKKELEKTYKDKETDLKNHQKRDMTLVDELAKKNDEIKKLKEDNLQLSVGLVDTDFVNKLIQETDYYKNKERIRTDQLRATESKVEELYKQIENLKKESKNKNDIIRKAYTRYIDEACKDREEIMDECYKNLTKDDTGYIGFKQYALRALEKEEGNEKEAKAFLYNEVSLIFYNKKAEEKRKEEETKKELNKK